MNKSPEEILQKHWGFSGFRGSQRKIIQSVLEGADVLALMPTGGGKSICFQVPALSREGICLVVSPLIALMQDQVQLLKSKKIKAIALTGGIPHREVDTLLDNCIHGNYKFLYLSPERLQQPLVKERIQQMRVNLIAIDEVHCISEWGHDFRPAYRQCALLRELQPNIPIIALTATATSKVVDDILLNLDIPKAKMYRDSFERGNIVFSVLNRQDKGYALKHLLGQNTKSAIVYVRSRKDAVLLARNLNQNETCSTYYHGGLSSLEKRKRLNDWLGNEVRIMVATNAFGMGVDKPDVQTVIHYQLPDSIENYYQEAGRAGRNGEPAHAVLLTNENDVERAKRQFLDTLPNLSYVKKIYGYLNTFFQVAYHEGPGKDFYLNLHTFCGRYDLDLGKTYTTLKLLDQNGIISLTETSKEMNTIQLIAHKEALFKWIGQHGKMGSVVQLLLRTYGGLFEFETKINLSLLSKKTLETPSYIDETLKKLEKDGLAHYKSIQHDLHLVFLKPREDDSTINPIAPYIDQLQSTKRRKLRSMLDYVNNTNQCRSQVLLDYFGERHSKACGKCDVCTEKAKGNNNTIVVKEKILSTLAQGDKTSRELVSATGLEEDTLLVSLKALLEDETLVLKSNNTYGIK